MFWSVRILQPSYSINFCHDVAMPHIIMAIINASDIFLLEGSCKLFWRWSILLIYVVIIIKAVIANIPTTEVIS